VYAKYLYMGVPVVCQIDLEYLLYAKYTWLFYLEVIPITWRLYLGVPVVCQVYLGVPVVCQVYLRVPVV